MISNLSQINESAVIGEGVQIDPFTMIHEDVVIGEGTWIGSNVTIFPGARIGKNCKIFPGAVISAIPQDLKFQGEETLVEIGDNTTIRECVTVNRGTKALGFTKIGKNCLIMATSHIAHDCEVGDFCIFSNSTTLAGHITIGDYVVLDSDIDLELIQLRAQGIDTKNITRCELFGKQLEDKLYAHHAIQDSIVVTDAEVNSYMEEQLDAMVEQVGSLDKVVKFYKKKNLDEFVNLLMRKGAS